MPGGRGRLSQLEIQTQEMGMVLQGLAKGPLGNHGSEAMEVEINLLLKPNGANFESDPEEARWYCEENP